MLKYIANIQFTSILAGAVMAGCVAGEYNAPSHMRVMREDAANRPYQFTTSTEIARVGETSQRFEIRHGDCGNWDCNNDRRRIEVNEYDDDRAARVGQTVWYGWSVYLPHDFQDITPANTHIGQAKQVRGVQMWDLNIRDNRLQFKMNTGETETTCSAIPLPQMRGRWTDIVVYANYAYENPSNEPMVQLWINGRAVCSSSRPMITRELVRAAGRDRITLRYGIYNGAVSRWLYNNRTRDVVAPGFEDVNATLGRGASASYAGRPFDIDWGVELPTQVVFYDEVRIGRSREDVDVRMRHSN